jgi:hypothetical protein
MKQIVFLIVAFLSFDALAAQPQEDAFEKVMFGDPNSAKAVEDYRNCIITHWKLDDYSSPDKSQTIIQKLVGKCSQEYAAWSEACVKDNHDRNVPDILTTNYCLYEGFYAANSTYSILNAIKATQPQ